jgi:signal transduction histidine kinase
VHDLRNPLAAIYGGAEMLVDADLSAEQQHRLATTIYSSSRRIQELLQELLDVSRGRTKAQEACSLLDLVIAAREHMLEAATSHSVAIEIDVPHNIEVLASRDRLERVFVNLIENAIDVMPDGGSIRINARVDKGHALVAVEDTGPGISEEAWGNLFHPFASFGKKNGLGLGLALSRQVLLDHGGDLWVDRRMASASGARFLMRLAIAPASLPLAHVSNGSTSRDGA